MLLKSPQIVKTRAPEISAAVLAVVLSAAGWLAYQYQTQVRWVEHTMKVQRGIGALLSTIQDAELGQKGYLLTGDRQFLEPYESAISVLPAKFDDARDLTMDNPIQQAALRDLRTLVDNRLFLLRARIDERENGTNTIAAFRQGKDLMDQIRTKLSTMMRTESELLDERTADSTFLMRATAAAAALAALLSLTLLGKWIMNSRQSTAELQSANQTLLQAIADREAADAKIRQLQKMDAIGQLTGGIAHDFNNMLAVIVGALGLAQKRISKGDNNIQGLIDGAMDGASRAAALTKRLLAFSRQQPLAPQTAAVNSVVSGMAELINRTLGEIINCETVLAAGTWTIHVDPPLLENAILNLCVNARDAMPEGGNLTIETANTFLDEIYAAGHSDVSPGQFVLVAVSDTGTGMTDLIASKAFDPFFTTKGVGKGTGLGLSQVHGFVKQSGGHIKIYTEVGSGTAVKMYFPRFIAADGEQPSRGRPAGVQRPRPGQTSQLILVVEDDARVRETSVAMLRELGYTCIHADSASAALRQLDAHSNVVLMFTDIVMPDVNGRKLAEEATKRWPNLKVLFTTGFTRNAVIHNGIIDAGVELIQKPFTVDELAAKIRAILDPVVSEAIN